jgi:2-polyprenyl-3-methyl-5-hydroxy-6-metoxy-1,4-benzoquinol methylase
LLKEDITKNYDLIILSDIIEHVEHDTGIIKKALEHSKYVALKIPIENFLFSRFFEFIGVKDKIGVNHSSGHLHEYSTSSVWNLFKEIDMEIMDFFFDAMNPKDTEFALDHKKQLNFIQRMYRKFKLLLFSYLSKKQYCKVFGGSLFVLIKSKGVLEWKI